MSKETQLDIARKIAEKVKESDALAGTIRAIEKGTGIDSVALLNDKGKITIPKNFEAIVSKAVVGVLQIERDAINEKIITLIDRSVE